MRRLQHIESPPLPDGCAPAEEAAGGPETGSLRDFGECASLIRFALIRVEPKFPAGVYVGKQQEENTMGKGLLLWLIGIPIPIILLIWLFGGLH
jgi:hypothetical protein